MTQDNSVSDDLEKTLQLDLSDIKSAPITIDPVDGELLPDDSPDQLVQALNRHRDLSQKYEDLKDQYAILRRKDETAQILNSQIKPLTDNSFKFMRAYSAIVGGILLLDGCAFISFELDASTLNFLVGSTATTVIGLVGMVLSGVFLNARK